MSLSDVLEQVRESLDNGGDSLAYKDEYAASHGLLVVEDIQKLTSEFLAEHTHAHGDEVLDGGLERDGARHALAADELAQHLAELRAVLAAGGVLKSVGKGQIRIVVDLALGNLVAEKSLELIVRDIHNIRRIISGHGLSEILDGGVNGALDLYAALETDIAARCADENLVIIGLNMPVAEVDIVERERALAEFDFDLFLLARLEENFLEALEFLLGAEDGAVFLGNIELGNLCAVSVAGVLYLEGNLESIGILDAVRRDLEVAVLESGVGQTEAEREQNVLFCGVIVAVADIQTFAILDSSGMSGGSCCSRECPRVRTDKSRQACRRG